MVCERCEEKLSSLIVPDKWTDGARSTTGPKDGSGKSGKDSGRNKLSKKRADRCVLSFWNVWQQHEQ